MENKENIAQNEPRKCKNDTKNTDFGKNNGKNAQYSEQKTEKTAEQKMEERTGASLMELIIGKTFARHSQLTEEEFLKEIGFENSGLDEDKAVRVAIMNVLVETTSQLLQAKKSLKLANGLLKTYLIDEKITESEEKGE